MSVDSGNSGLNGHQNERDYPVGESGSLDAVVYEVLAGSLSPVPPSLASDRSPGIPSLDDVNTTKTTLLPHILLFLTILLAFINT